MIKNTPSTIKTITVNAYEYGVTPTSGVRLWAYTHCIFNLNRMFDTNAWIPVANIVNFFETRSIISHHTKEGNLEFKPDNKGFVRLTTKGKNFFLGRVNGMNSKQKIDSKSINETIELIWSKPIPHKTRAITIQDLS